MSPSVDPNAGPNMLNPRLKMSWAKVHLDRLKREVAHFLENDGYSVSEEDDLEAGEYIVKIKGGNLHIHTGMILGDFLNCLRGSLDHLAYQLTLIPEGTRNERASFPIIDVDNSNSRRSFAKATEGIPDPAADVIRDVQPYHDGKAYEVTHLWKLHRLWNIDKHRRVPFHATRGEIQIRFPTDVTPFPGWADNHGVARFPLSAKGKVHFDPTVKPTVQFGDESEGIIVTLGDLIEIHEFVCRDLMPRFEGFFEKIVVTG